MIRDSDDEEELKKPNTRQSKKASQTIVLSSSISSGGTPSPKSRKSDKPKQQQDEPLNLVSASQVASQKKKSTTPAPLVVSGRKAESELETAISQLKFDEFKSEHAKLKALFPNSITLVIENLIAFANQKLQTVPEFEPSTEQVPNPSNLNSQNRIQDPLCLSYKLEQIFSRIRQQVGQGLVAVPERAHCQVLVS